MMYLACYTKIHIIFHFFHSKCTPGSLWVVVISIRYSLIFELAQEFFFFGGNGFSSRSFLQKTNQEILIYGILAILLSFFSHFLQLKIKSFFLFLHFQHNIYSLHIFCWILIKLLYWFLLLYYYFILLLDYILIGYWIGLFDDFFTNFTCFTPFKAIILTIFTIFTILAFHTIFTLHKRISTRESRELFISLT